MKRKYAVSAVRVLSPAVHPVLRQQASSMEFWSQCRQRPLSPTIITTETSSYRRTVEGQLSTFSVLSFAVHFEVVIHLGASNSAFLAIHPPPPRRARAELQQEQPLL